MATLAEDFEGGSNGATVTTLNSAFNLVGSGTPTFDTSIFYRGSASRLIDNAGLPETNIFTFAATNQVTYRKYIRPKTLGASRSVICSFNSAGTPRAQLCVDIAGTISLRDGASTVVATTSAVMSLNADFYRVECQIDGATGSQSVQLYLGDSTVPVTGGTDSGTFTNLTFDRAVDGLTNSTSLTYNDDLIKITSGSVAPIGAEPLAASIAVPVYTRTWAVPLLQTAAVDVTLSPDTLALPWTVQPLAGLVANASAVVNFDDPLALPWTLLAPTVVAGSGAAIAVPKISLPWTVPNPSVQAGSAVSIAVPVTGLPWTVRALAGVGTGLTPVSGTGSAADLIFAWLGAQGVAGPSLADREWAYYSSRSGLPAGRSLADHKRAYYGAQLALSAAQLAATSLTGLELAYWATIVPSAAGSYADRQRRFHGG